MVTRVLLVDDDPDDLEEMQSVLESEDFTVVTADSGKAALALLQEADFDVVITDAHMPEMDGVELIELLAAVARPPVPVVMVTQFPSYVRPAYNAGAVAFICKPIGRDSFGTQVRDAIEKIESSEKGGPEEPRET